MTINEQSSTFTSDQLQQIFSGLKKGCLPIKFAYLTQLGSEGWGQVESERVKKGEYSMDTKLLETSIETYLEELGYPECIQFIDIGGGYGYTANSILEIFQQKGVGVHYHTIDISQILLNHCTKNTSQTSISQSGHLLDIDDGGIAKKIREIKISTNNIPVFATLLGNTLGNFMSPNDVIRQIMDGLDTNDRFIVGTHLFKPGYETCVLKEYETNRRVHDMLSATFRSIGVKGNIIRTHTNWDYKSTSVRGYLTIQEPTIIKDNFRENITLPSGYRIEVMKSTKFSIQSLIDTIGSNRIASIKTDVRGLYSQVMLSPINLLL